MPISTSFAEIVASDERKYCKVVDADEALPRFRTVARSVNDCPVVSVLSLTEGDSTIKSGLPLPLTVILTPDEQLFPVLLSPLTLSTHAP